MAFLQHVLITREIFSIICNPATKEKPHTCTVYNLSLPGLEVWVSEVTCRSINTMLLIANSVLSPKISGFIYCISSCSKLIIIITLHLGDKFFSMKWFMLSPFHLPASLLLSWCHHSTTGQGGSVRPLKLLTLILSVWLKALLTLLLLLLFALIIHHLLHRLL